MLAIEPMKLRLALTIKLEKLAYQLPWIRWILCHYYRLLTYSELKRVSLTHSDRVLCIGGGPMPETASLIQRLTKTTVDVIDSDPDAIEQMYAYLAKHPTHNLRPQLADGQDIKIGDYRLIHVAKQVMPKETVVSHLQSQLRADQTLIIRWCFFERLQFLASKVLKDAKS